MKLSTVVLAGLGVAVTSVGCSKLWGSEPVQGSGEITTETRTVPDFDKIDLEGSYQVILTQDAARSLRIETDKNLLSYIKTEVKNGKLTVSSDGNLHPTHEMKIYISNPNFESIETQGSAKVTATTPITSDALAFDIQGSGNYDLEVHAKELSSSIAGSGKIALRGSARSHSISIAGSGNIDALNMPADTSSVDISGSGNADLMVASKLNAEIAGSGRIRYKGNVQNVETSVAGSGKIERVN